MKLSLLLKSPPEGGYEAKSLTHSIFTEADTIDELKKRVKDAVRCHFEKEDMPQIIRLHFIREEIMAA